MLFYPKLYLENILQINYELLETNNIQGLILDMDNTIIDFNKNILNGTRQWCDNLKEKKIKLIIVSNSNKKDKIEKTSKELDIPYIMFAKKPLKTGLLKACSNLKLNPKNVAVVGDQIFTDVLGANRCKMFSVLVKPLDNKDIFITVMKRPLENYIIKKYLKSNKEEMRKR